MVNREMIKQEVDRFRSDQLERVAEFIAFIKFREANPSNNWHPLIDRLSLFSQDFMTS